jgi:ADP-heptose:LPS heptosyltransferase
MIGVFIDTLALGDTIAAIPACKKIAKAYDNEEVHIITNHPYLFEGHPSFSHISRPESTDLNHFRKVHRMFMPLVGKSYQLHNGETIEWRYSNMDIRQFHAVSQGFALTEQEMETDLYIERKRELPVSSYVMIHPTFTWESRTWAQEKWQALVDKLNDDGIPVVAVGRSGKEQGFFNVDKPVMDLNIRYGVNLLDDLDNDVAELRWMMNHQATCVVTMDSGILHVAGTTDVNLIQLGSSIDPKLRAPYRQGSQAYKYQYVKGSCDLFCSSNMKYNVKVHGSIHGVPPQVYCLEGKPTFECHPSVDQVFEAIQLHYKVKAKIKIVHLLLEDDLDQDRQTKSIESISRLEKLGIEYIQVWNKRWTETPPRETFTRPDQYDSIPIRPGHYGNFRAFADAAIEHFTEDLDFFIICEGDAILEVDLKTALQRIDKASESIIKNDISYFSFGSRFLLDSDELQSETIQRIEDTHLVNRIICAHMVMFPKRIRKYLLDKYKYATWDGADIFLNDIFFAKFNLGMFEDSTATQLSGVSAIESHYREYNN